MKVNAVFEGGGVKGIALAGAVSAAEKQGIEFHQVAGTSSGSIIASLIAAGYSGEETRKLVEQTPFSSFLKRSWIFERPKIIGPAARLFIKKGLYSGEALEYWIYQLLEQKGIRTFGDLKPNQLRIIASDITLGRLLVLPDDIANYGIDPQKFLVARAIRMSTSIPYFFDPVIIRKPVSMRKKNETFQSMSIYIVDGALLSNFPLWLFDKQYENNMEKMIPTLGFQLVGKTQAMPNEIYGPLSMFRAMFSTMLEAHDERYIEEHNRFRTIKIPTLGVRATQFEITPEESGKLYQSGYTSAEVFFNKWKLSDYENNFKQYMSRKK
ncbi:patatin-like phospholipase family protein [Paenibacillus thalictri]|uniref:Patatin n=1 Tax=Paenibacillus thalictri TaxID=2527873 RepID=A0A4Q9DXF2_9BACL|nr:patatin-like phospholipase family protein [Paenibacillus thalictri]TBL79911.1 patatin [Paenibacillus thalictri]